MTEGDRILVVVDPTADAQPAFERGLWLAERLGAALELFICDYDAHLAGKRFYDADSLGRARETRLEADGARLAALAAQAEARGVPASVDVQWDHPLHAGIVRKTAATRPAFVLKDTHYHELIRRSIFSNTDWQLIRECPAPLWLVKPHEPATRPVFLAAVDPLHERDKPADLDREIVALARRLGDALGGRLELFHAFDPTPAFAASGDANGIALAAPDGVLDELRVMHAEAVRALAAAHGVPDARVHVLDGGTRELLVDLVGRLAADCVVMGAVSRNALQRLFLGSTAEEVLDRLPCDVLVVKPPSVPRT